jgi:hypothetical protein
MFLVAAMPRCVLCGYSLLERRGTQIQFPALSALFQDSSIAIRLADLDAGLRAQCD